MNKIGRLSKMVVSHTSPVSYALPLGEFLLPLNDLIGKSFALEFTGLIQCMACGREIKKSFQQGYCFPCTRKLAQCDLCILKPVLCHYHKGTCREPLWGDTHCMIPHVVYLSNTSGLKVGITRKNQIPTRWIDQGAVAAIPIFEVATRRISGIIEAELSKNMSDRTSWQTMLKGSIQPLDLVTEKHKLITATKDLLEKTHGEFPNEQINVVSSDEVFEFQYPVSKYPSKVTSLSFDKTPRIEGCLLGIKGQYLIFDIGVMNMRNFGGYNIRFLLS